MKKEDCRKFWEMIVETNGKPTIKELEKFGYGVEHLIRLTSHDSKNLVDTAKKLLEE